MKPRIRRIHSATGTVSAVVEIPDGITSDMMNALAADRASIEHANQLEIARSDYFASCVNVIRYPSVDNINKSIEAANYYSNLWRQRCEGFQGRLLQ
jgi:hypothetical protein